MFDHVLIISKSVQLLHQPITEPDTSRYQLDFLQNARNVGHTFQCLWFAQGLGNPLSSLWMMLLLAMFHTTHVDVKLSGLYHAHQLHTFLISGAKNTETLVMICSPLDRIFVLYTRENEESMTAQLSGNSLSPCPWLLGIKAHNNEEITWYTLQTDHS